MRNALSLSICCWLFFSTLPTPGRAASAKDPGQPSPPTFPTEVELVTVDAVVVDGKGAPVSGLGREDFIVSEDGAQQPIDSFEAVVLPTVKETPKTTPHPAVSSNTSAEVRSGRVFAIVFDDMHLSHLQAHRAKEAVARFLTDGVSEGDRVMLAATSGGASWSARMTADRDELISVLKRLDGRRVLDTASADRMTDYEALRIVQFHDTVVAQRVVRRFDDAGLLNDVRLTGNDKYDPVQSSSNESGVTHRFVEQRAQEVYDEAQMRNRITLQSIGRLLDGLSVTKGRKSLMLISEGFIQDTTLGDVKDVVRAARQANVAIYFVDTRGLEGTSSLYSAEFGIAPTAQDIGPQLADLTYESQGSEELASATGGFSVKNSNDLAGGIGRISNELKAYYLLGYHPKQTASDGRFHKIDVRVNRKNVTVRARRGYYARDAARTVEKPKDEAAIDPALQRAVDAPFELDNVPLRVTAFTLGETLVGRAKVVLAAEVDLRNLAFEKQADRLVDTIDLLLFVRHRESGDITQSPEEVEMRLKPQTLDRNPWYPLVREFDLGAGAYQAKLVVRDRKGGRLGSVLHSFTVPDLGVFRAATPVLASQVQPEPEDPKTLRPVLQVGRSFATNATLYCQIEVFNADKDLATGRPRVTQGFALTAKNGGAVLQAEPTPINPSPTGAVSRLMAIPTRGLQPGEYELKLRIKDEISGQTLELNEPLTLVAAS